MEEVKLPNKKELLREIKNIKKKMLKLDLLRLCLFIFDVIVFSIVLVFFIISWADHYITNNYDQYKYFSYVILTGSFYLLIKFPCTLFFFTGTYYKKIIIYEKEILIDKTKSIFKKEVSYKSISFMLFFILINIFIAIILNDESKILFKNDPLIDSFIQTASLLLLTPCFVFSLNSILFLKKNLSNQYKVLIRNQFLANIDLFMDYQPINNFERIQLKDLEIRSKRGTFLLANYVDNKLKKEIIKHNEEIIKLYHDLWRVYCNYLFLINSTEHIKKVNKITNFNIQNFFDSIFDDFFDFK